MNFDLDEEFEQKRWKLLALVEARKSLRDGSENAIKTDRMILATRELVRAYETLKGYWSHKPAAPRRRRPGAGKTECGEAGRKTGAATTVSKALRERRFPAFLRLDKA